MTAVLATPEIEKAYRDIVKLRALQATCSEKIADAEALIRRVVPVGAEVFDSDGGRKILAIKPPNRSFDLETAVQLLNERLPTEKMGELTKTDWDTAKVKKALTGEELDLAMLPGRGQPRIDVTA
jgi:hypothetical protein